MIKLLHAADLHLDAAFTSLPPELAIKRRAEQRDVLRRLSAAAQGCDLVLLAGDLFDGEHVYRDTIDALKDCFANISAQIVIAPGNHDLLREGSPYLTEAWGENVHIFRNASIECLSLPACDIYGAAYLREDIPVLEGFRVRDEGKLNLMVLHSGGSYNPITQEQIEASGLDYLALGHVHAMQTHRAGKTNYAYPGCLMGRGFDECGQKGLLRVELSKQHCKIEFVPIRSRKYEIVTVQVGEDILRSIEEAWPEESQNDCLRLILQGESDGVNTEALERELQGRCFSLSIRDRTVPKRGLWEGSDDSTLRGEILHELKTQYEEAEPERARQIARAARLLSDLMDGREVSL